VKLLRGADNPNPPRVTVKPSTFSAVMGKAVGCLKAKFLFKSPHDNFSKFFAYKLSREMV
jgi:hypothetical protein